MNAVFVILIVCVSSSLAMNYTGKIKLFVIKVYDAFSATFL
jgi:hypothetical protein